MDQNVKIFLELDDDSSKAIESNNIDIEVALKERDIQTSIEKDVVNLEDNGTTRTRAIVTIIIAASAAVAAIGYAISNIISANNYKTHIIVIEGLEELRDAKGEVILGTDGKPIFKVVKALKVVEPGKRVQSSFELELFKIFKIKISTR